MFAEKEMVLLFKKNNSNKRQKLEDEFLFSWNELSHNLRNVHVKQQFYEVV